MINVHVLAGLLLTLRLIAVFFLFFVLKRQWTLFKIPDVDLTATRKILFALVCITFIGQFVPILIDTAALVGSYVRSQPAPLGIAYALSNATTAAISSFGWWYLYRSIGLEGIRLAKIHHDLKAHDKGLADELKKEKAKR